MGSCSEGELLRVQPRMSTKLCKFQWSGNSWLDIPWNCETLDVNVTENSRNSDCHWRDGSEFHLLGSDLCRYLPTAGD